MDVLAWVVVAVLVVLVALVVTARRMVRKPGIDPTDLLLDPALMARVKELAISDRKIQAIKELRDGVPGLGLATAKTMVDRMAAGARPVPPPAPAAPTVDPTPVETVDPVPSVPPVPGPVPAQGTSPDGGLDAAPSSSPVPLEVELEVRTLRSAGNTAAAIKLVRERTGMDQIDATYYVNSL
ncbi:hypothetical protein GIS00_18145 [Nakamurella sp. YIM 132087]|uniref:Ribosomal protein L7/L12 C-terminal domain-containing protein n=1 Tax=Nakamurella alba TaxID=2665158 RepID=A0A7K1FP47_9ACTN|nr:hypothetical protein [Nakamurella alba]MTD15860.1 hypothetical protein [Nakamurella alba]